MGVSVHGNLAERLKGRRNKSHTTKTNWSERRAAKTKEKPAWASQPVDFPRMFFPGFPSLRSSPSHPH
jgi:hypothetical protein